MPTEWEGVARFEEAELDRLTEFRRSQVLLRHAYGVGQLVCCQLMELQCVKDAARPVPLLGPSEPRQPP